MRARRALTAPAAAVLALLLMGMGSCDPIDCNDRSVIGDPPAQVLVDASKETVEGEAVEVEAEVKVREPHPSAGEEVECVVVERGGKGTWENVTDDAA